MKKRFLFNLIVLSIAFIAISNISFAAGANETDPDGKYHAKGTVTIEEGAYTETSGKNTESKPLYHLTMGESVIDIYYEKESELPIHFTFTDGSCNAGNYIVEHNPDKHRLRFTLLGTGNRDILKVTSEKGLNYLQAGGENYVSTISTNDDGNASSGDVQIPFYNIEATETFNASTTVSKTNYKQRNGVSYVDPNNPTTTSDGGNKEVSRNVQLANSYLVSSESTIGSNVSPYGMAYIFSKSGIDYTEAYKLGDEQLNYLDVIQTNYNDIGNVKYLDSSMQTFTAKEKQYNSQTRTNENVDVTYSCGGPVTIVYEFKGANSPTQDAAGEKANWFESLFTKLITSVGDGFVTLTKLGTGGKDAEYYVTIDALVFNEYPYTIVDFFGETGYTNGIAKEVINAWFKIFEVWAIIIYLIMLVYVGIKAMLLSGTPEQKKLRPTLEGWIIGLILLFTMPFAFKYMIKINDMLVDILRTNSEYSIYAYYSFEDDYKVLGDKEDGEDSTTDIVAKLLGAKGKTEEQMRATQQQISDLQAEQDYLQEEINNYTDNSSNIENRMKNKVEDAVKGKQDYGYAIIDEYDNVVSPSQIYNEIISALDEANKNYNPSKDTYDAGLVVDLCKKYSVVNADDHSIEVPDFQTTTFRGVLAEAFDEYDDYRIYESSFRESELEQSQKETELSELENKLRSINKAIEIQESGKTDILGHMRKRVGDTGKLFYFVIWIILLLEVIFLLILYYKRLFMIAVLIAVFPLVTVSYAYEKASGKKSTVFKNWMEEFTINVFIQTAHALLYVTLIELGYSVFLNNNESWLIYMIAVISLITSENILKKIMGLRGNTVTNLSSYLSTTVQATVATGALISTFKDTKEDLKSIDNASKNKETKIEGKQKENDKRLDTIRRDRDNKLRSRTNLTDAEKDAELKKRAGKREKADESKKKRRENATKRRARRAEMQKLNRQIANYSSAFGAVAGGLAMGPDVGNMATSSAIATTLTGTGEKVSLSDAAKERDERLKAEAEKANVKNEIGNVTTDGSIPSGGSVHYSGNGSFNGASGSGNSNMNVAPKVVHNTNPVLRQAFANRLAEEKVYYKEKVDIRDEEE